MTVDDHGPEVSFVWLKVGSITIYSCYWSPSSSMHDYEDFIICLEVHIRNAAREVIVAGDFNAKYSAWNAAINDKRGEVFMNLVQSLDLLVCNQGCKLTREKDSYESFIDVSLATVTTASKVADWKVLDEESLSHHNYISYTANTGTNSDSPWAGW